MRAACGTRCFSACVVRALLCTSTPVESYAIITRFSLALTIQTTRLLLTAFYFAGFARPTAVPAALFGLSGTGLLRPWHA